MFLIKLIDLFSTNGINQSKDESIFCNIFKIYLKSKQLFYILLVFNNISFYCKIWINTCTFEQS